ncbi:Leucine-rich repeat [Trypanosoma melophagium]|uniref:Leucine-rich repeat n=1 Tax=Trypanosoma melophagium TaxID=715481 RepID=UPI00351AA3A8|nr:Leucine-rich repeat [Trypanosoma melophagium]
MTRNEIDVPSFPITTALRSVISYYDASHNNIPLALLCASPVIRWICEEKRKTIVGLWCLHLACDGSRSISWTSSSYYSYSSYCCVLNTIASIAWWCNRPAFNGNWIPPTCIEFHAGSCFIVERLNDIFAFQSLVQLSLRRAHIKDVNILGKLPFLKRLDLTQSHVVDSGIKGLGNSSSLVDVTFWGCNGITDVNTLCKIPTLEKLDLAETSVCDEGVAELSNSLSIKLVNMEACRFIKNVGCFGKLQELQKLFLVVTSVTNDGIVDLCYSKSIVELDLWGCIAVNDVNLFGKIPTLRRLDLFGTSVTNEGIMGLGESNSLEEIDFTCCGNLSDVSVLTSIHTLRHVVLLHTSVQNIAVLIDKGVTVEW